MGEQPTPEDEYPDVTTMKFVFDLVEVSHPERWWSATRRQLVEQTDPDVDDGAQRHPDRDDIRWHLVGDVLSQVSAKLDARDYRDSDALSDTVEVDVIGDTGGYTLAEMRILESWFSFGSYPKADGWNRVSGDGRHRIWNIFAHLPDALLPLRSHLLDFIDDVDHEHLAATLREQAAKGVAELPVIVRERSPHYVQQLRLAAQLTLAPKEARA